jgi:hypothetical protein
MNIKTLLVGLSPLALGACATLFPASPFAYDKKGELVEFNYAWSAEASRTPALARKLKVDLEREFQIAATAAEVERAAARAAGKTYRGSTYSRRWTTAGQSARLLSLDGRLKTRDGSGNVARRADGLLWDRSARSEVAVDRLFDTSGAADAMLRLPGCAKLRNAAPTCRREVAIIPVDSDRNRRFDHFRLIVPSSSAEAASDPGEDLSVPVSASMLAALKPGYRAGFEVAQPQ